MPSTKDRKRKAPPTFQHRPAQRAKKLKRDWVETKKIKSRWRHEKRKDNLRGHDVHVMARAHEDGGRGASAEASDERGRGGGEGSPSMALPPASAVKEQSPPRRNAHAGLSHSTPTRAKIETSRTHAGPSSRGHGRGRGFGSTGGARKHGGRGGHISGKEKQPDMRVKMGALLEKIKKDYAEAPADHA